MISIFGKLYTLLRRPQAAQKTDSPDYGDERKQPGSIGTPVDSRGQTVGKTADTKTHQHEDSLLNKPVGGHGDGKCKAEHLKSGSHGSGDWEHIQVKETSDVKKIAELTESTSWENIPSPGENSNNNARNEPSLSEAMAQCEGQMSTESVTISIDTATVGSKQDRDVDQPSTNTQTDMAQRRNKGSSEKPKDGQTKTETSQEKMNNSQLKVETSQTKLEGSQARAETSQEKMDTSQEKVEISQEKVEFSKTTKTSQKQAETIDDKSQICQEKPETEQEKSTSGQRKHDSRHKKGRKTRQKRHEHCEDRQAEQNTSSPPISENDYEHFIEFVAAKTEAGQLISAKDLVYKLGYQKNLAKDLIEKAIIGQYNVAKDRHNSAWIKEGRFYAGLFFCPQWIGEHMTTGDSRSQDRKPKPKKPQTQEDYVAGGICKDVRLKDNPNMERIVADAASDGARPSITTEQTTEANVKPAQPDVHPARDNNSEPIVEPAEHTAVEVIIEPVERDVSNNNAQLEVMVSQPGIEDTEQMIQSAMKMAIDDGLSTSAIMEVIEDVANMNTSTSDTPRKRRQPVKVDLTRTPRARPEQLAVGFNYHSDVVVKESPKTVGGQIIPLDILPPPKHRVEQLAVGFNFLADQLIKNSPRSDTGEIIIPGVITTPRRLARDPLAMGFNYHSDIIAKENSFREENDEMDKNDNSSVAVNNCSGKCLESDSWTVHLEPSLDCTEGISNGSVNDLIVDASLGDSGKVVEESMSLDALPAGKIW